MNAIRGRTLTYLELLDMAVAAYWRNRPNPGPRCGTIYGYNDHRYARRPICADCRNARRMVVAIQRHRAKAAA